MFNIRLIQQIACHAVAAVGTAVGMGTAENHTSLFNAERSSGGSAETFAVALVDPEQIVTENGNFFRPVIKTYRRKIEVIIFADRNIVCTVSAEFGSDFRRNNFFDKCCFHDFYPLIL